MEARDESDRYRSLYRAAFFMIIPSAAGTIGLVLSLVSPIPWHAFVIGLAKVFRAEGAR